MGRQRQRQRQRRAQRQDEQRDATGQRPPSGTGGGGKRPPSKGRSSGGNQTGMIVGIAIVVLAIIAFIYGATHGYGKTSSPPPTATAAPTPTPINPKSVHISITPTPIAALEKIRPARPVDGVQCGAMEQLAYHIHQHLALYDNGKPVTVPSEIGIPGGEEVAQCYYWIHVHAATPNIIHVESPIKKTYDLGNFFDIWVVTRNSTIPSGDAFVKKLRAAAARGQVTAYLNGNRWNGDYRLIPLKEHSVITVEIGKPRVAPKPYTNWQGL